ncbi:Hypothetical protein PP7435_CHR2-0422 [Komagataella phaffii CBS 7435]|uniref:Uncharacterized protein n=2 Tax=Komagataella phaffii TaxID=460519 RepID=C4R1Y1_KOMPG|nr:Hypothetical protein PAS_chr2-2_0403 [Komagataella phaffii GS115]AOA62393.1 GQ67_00926T0 [Komagataella phaffii]KAI0461218.1 hypothetical protein LJB42_001235 [Komagataella kurtzmanii]CAH2447951.1 Hypothetical protein BQ9382_C2-2290 [Komagataella phaffii CBS 7435]AOA67297.1 GQ68_00463T0 [Komagataella phaffii GS115]CAY69505.1 Hypothetical protein PAS_chr2-2_0403 [Komagataella phaffii GS115]
MSNDNSGNDIKAKTTGSPMDWKLNFLARYIRNEGDSMANGSKSLINEIKGPRMMMARAAPQQTVVSPVEEPSRRSSIDSMTSNDSRWSESRRSSVVNTHEISRRPSIGSKKMGDFDEKLVFY